MTSLSKSRWTHSYFIFSFSRSLDVVFFSSNRLGSRLDISTLSNRFSGDRQRRAIYIFYTLLVEIYYQNMIAQGIQLWHVTYFDWLDLVLLQEVGAQWGGGWLYDVIWANALQKLYFYAIISVLFIYSWQLSHLKCLLSSQSSPYLEFYQTVPSFRKIRYFFFPLWKKKIDKL